MDADGTPRILQLAATISDSVAKVHDALAALGSASPSFDEDAPAVPTSLDEVRNIILDATSELQGLFSEPLEMFHQTSRADKTACLQIMARFGIASLVPPGGRISFAEIASQTPLTEQMVGRIIRHAAVTMRVFCEPEPGVVAHTKASRRLADPDIRDWIRAGTEELGPAGGKLAEALEKWPGSQEPSETGFALANNASIFEVLAAEPSRAVRFANAMRVMTSKPEFDPSYATDYYDWSALGECQVVDVGGGQGHVAAALCKSHGALRVLVQDMAGVVQGADESRLGDRVTLVAHDLFAAQTVTAEVYFFRWVFHNWSDEYCLRILRAQVPALRPGVRIVVQDAIMPEPGTAARWREKDSRAIDLEMAYTFNARERTLANWKELFAQADPAFVLKKVIEPKGSVMSILEFVWNAGA